MEIKIVLGVVNAAWVVDVVCHIPRDYLQTKNTGCVKKVVNFALARSKVNIQI